MTDLFSPLGANLIFASGVWLLSLRRRNASLVDLIWPLMFVLANRVMVHAYLGPNEKKEVLEVAAMVTMYDHSSIEESQFRTP